MNWLKRLYARIFPASKYQVNVSTEKLQEKIEKQSRKIEDNITTKIIKNEKKLEKQIMKFNELLSILSKSLEQQNNELTQLKNKISGLEGDNHKLRQELNVQLRQELNVQLRQELNNYNSILLNRLSNIDKFQQETLGFARENNYGIIFNNTITDSDWLKQTNFSLGRWAIGYQCAYVLFRVLNEIKPKQILELGLGQSTKIIGQYSNYYNDIQHTVVESDLQWIDFFTHDYPLDEKTNILHCEYTFQDYQEYSQIRVFEGFDEKIKDKKYDLIIIDAPFGGDMNELSRIDVLKNIPGCLNDSFVIIFDDINRIGENNTFTAMKDKLTASKIEYSTGLYQGKKSVGVIVSEDLKFITTM